ncbi:WYL domain-containing protein [Pseudomonas fortuita]|uniref:WYL domain-containing protein n=1 Tax=Pseudomonas fortuita TaxID=3233375 RepID=A0ACD4P5B1_9PSED|nr:WYL domain-containing protein [Pseudomonas putida]WAP63118.1 WYL domain-containing protein [Pseudomonas putida]
MPSAKTHNALSRQWELLQQLPKRPPGITVTELHTRLVAAGYAISRRSVERDLHDLSLVFPLQCNDAGTPFGWYWKPGVSVELQGITLTEAVSLVLVEDAVRPLLPGSMLSVLEPRFEHARQKLRGLEEGNPAARWPDKVASVRPDFNLRAPEIQAETLEALQQALISEQQVHCQYYSAHSDKLSELTLNPLAIVQRGLITYLIATALPYTDVRQFAVHRFCTATVLDSACQGLGEFELQAYLATDALQFGKPEKIRFKAWVSEYQARLIRETPLSTDMRLEPLEQGFQLQATVTNSWQLHWWILSLGDSLVVQEPPALRQQVSDTLRRAAAAYEPDTCHCDQTTYLLK